MYLQIACKQTFSLTDNETRGSNATLVCKVAWSRCHDLKGGFSNQDQL